MSPGGRRHRDRPSTYVLLLVGLMAGAVAYPDGFEIVALAATVVVLLLWGALLLAERIRGPRWRR